MITRRTLLALAGTAVAGLISGCVSRIPGVDRSDDGRDDVGIDLLAVHNDDEESREATVVIEDGDGTEVFREEYALEPGTADGLENPVDGKGDYTVRATVGTTTVRDRLSTGLDTDERCVVVRIRVRNPDQVFIRPQIYTRCTDD